MTSEAREGFYTSGVPQAEINRLGKFTYPDEVSVELLSDSVSQRKVLDVGAGSSPRLGKWIESQGGEYVALDVAPELISGLRKNAGILGIVFNEIVRGRIQTLPFRDKSIDVSHARFVLMHLPPGDRASAIQELLRVSSQRVYSMEWNWRTMTSKANPQEIGEFKELQYDLAELFGVDLNMGEGLDELVRKTVETTGQKYEISVKPESRSEDDYTKDIEGLCEMAIGKLSMFLQDERATSRFGKERLQNLLSGFNAFLTRIKESPIKFVPPEIVIATIEKK